MKTITIIIIIFIMHLDSLKLMDVCHISTINQLKVHENTILTCATKNTPIFAWQGLSND